jgi:glycosyltransferase involved in cell wall biosynthesis
MEEIENEVPGDIQIIGCNDREAKGKGWAMRTALAQATGTTVIFIDGDGDISPRMILRLLPYLRDYDIVCGVKPISGRWSRRVLSYFSRIYIALLFGVKVDSQTGIKAFRTYALGDWYSNGWLFDLEILSVAKQKGMSMIEVPIEFTPGNKKVKLISIWKTLKESWTLWLELR